MSAPPDLVPELDVTDIPASLRFYENVLGFSVLYARPDEGFVYLGHGGAHLMLQQATGPGRRFRTAALDRPFGRGINFQLEVSDVTAVHDRAVLSDCGLVVGLEDRWYRTGELESGQRQLVIADPDGYLWRPFERLGERPAVGTGAENDRE